MTFITPSKDKQMIITINGQNKEFTNEDHLKGIIEQFCRDTQHIIAEVNGNIVKSHQWQETNLKDGDKVELVSFVGGG